MQPTLKFISRAVAVIGAMAFVPLAQAAYPKQMAVKVEMWNDTDADLYLVSASWLPPGTDLSNYVMPGDLRNATFGFSLKNPRNDSATYRMQDGARVCEFNLGHEKTFSWLGVNPAPDKFASARSVGTSPATCSASVIRGLKSLGAYTVRVKMGDANPS
jgi:hypothetical protein